MSSSNIKSDDQEEQLYLLEVIVDSLDVYKEGILETFQENAFDPGVGESTEDADASKPKQGPIRVLVKFFDFPTIEIQEREFKENEEQKDPEIHEEDEPNKTSATTEKDSAKSTEQSVIKDEDPIYKNKKAEEARWKSEGRRSSNAPEATEFPGSIPTSNRFTNGKSCLFPMVPKEMIDVIRKHPIEVQVHRDATENEPAHLIGKTRLTLGQEFIDAIAIANTPTVLPVSAYIEDDFEVTNVFGDVTGTLSLLVRLSCFGATIFTQFKYIQGEKGFKFSTSEGVMKSKYEGDLGVQKKEEIKPEVDKLEERMPYFTGDDNIGMYVTTTHTDEKFKVPVPWRKLHDEPITPQICGPKRLFKEPPAQKAKKDCPMYDFDQMFPSVAQPGFNTSTGRSLYLGQPMVSGNIFEGSHCRGQDMQSTVCVPPEFGSSMPSEIKRLLPGQRGTGRGALDIPPGTKFPCQFGADWISEANPCSCSSKSRKTRGGGCCMTQPQMIPCPSIPNARSYGAGPSWGSQTASYVCSNTKLDTSREYPPVEHAPPHLRSAMESPNDNCETKSSQQMGSILRPDVRYIPCPNSPDTRTGRDVVCGLEALADPNQRNLQNLMRPTLIAPKCPPDSSRNRPSLCTCPKVPTVVPPPVPGGVLRCECSNILTALKPIEMPYSCWQPEPQPTVQPNAASSCPPCPPVPIKLPPRAPECPLAMLLKDAQNESKQEHVKTVDHKQDPPEISSEPPQHVAIAPKPDGETAERSGVHTEVQKSATFIPPDSSPKSGQTIDEPASEAKTKKHATKEKVNKILQEGVSAAGAAAQVSHPTDQPHRELEDRTSKAMSLSSDTTPSKRRKNRKAGRRSKDIPKTPYPDAQDKELNIAYTPTAGIYPGMVIGHKNCVPVIRLVPKRMGWLWNIKDGDGFMKLRVCAFNETCTMDEYNTLQVRTSHLSTGCQALCFSRPPTEWRVGKQYSSVLPIPGRGWRPGSIQTNVMKVMDNVKTNINKQSKEKRALKATRSDHHPRKVESGRLLTAGDTEDGT